MEETTARDLQETTTQIQIDDSFESAALASEQSGDYLAAASYWQSLLDREPTNLEAAVGFAENLRRLEQYGHAIDVLQTALSHHPDNPQLLGLYGRTLVSDGDAAAAIEPLGRAVAADPDVWETHAALGVAYGVLGESERANDANLRALSISPGNPKVLNNMALESAMNGNLDNAIELLERAVEHSEADITVRQNLALVLAYRGDIDRAEMLVREDLPEDMADRNVSFYRSLADDDLENIEDLVNQSSFVVEEEALSVPSTVDDSVNLAYVETAEVPDTAAEFDSFDGVVVVTGQETLAAVELQDDAVETGDDSVQSAQTEDFSTNAAYNDGVSNDLALAPQRIISSGEDVGFATIDPANASVADTQTYVLNDAGNISSVTSPQQPSPEETTEQGSADDGALAPERFTRTDEEVEVVAIGISPDAQTVEVEETIAEAVDPDNEVTEVAPATTAEEAPFDPILELIGSITTPASEGDDVAVIDDQGNDAWKDRPNDRNDELPTGNTFDLQYLESALESSEPIAVDDGDPDKQ